MSRRSRTSIIIFFLLWNLFLQVATALCWDGPVVQLNLDCGGYGGGMGSCRVVWTPGGGSWACQGYCQKYCPQGGVPDEGCLGVRGGCRCEMVRCNDYIRYKCQPRMFGPPSCVCEDLEAVVDSCLRQECWEQ